MTWFLQWLAALELMALAALPLAVRLLGFLPDRGYIFAKPLGMLLLGYICWLLGVFGLLQFQQTTIALVLAGLAAVAWAKWGRDTLKALSGALAVVLAVEVLFIIALAAASLIRAYNPEIAGTEKPMDFAFLNALYRTDTLPPEDPWMSGHSISYYYFGYLLLAVVAKLSSVPPSVGYNLGVALIFSLLLAGSFSLSFNLISMLRPQSRLPWRLGGALLAPLLVGLMGNLEVGLEVLAGRGVGDSSFWQWVGIKGLNAAAQPDGWIPTSHWWWWRASRIIPTIKPDGINEFPYFSFLLGDLHPHYMALPWAMLSIVLALGALARGGAGPKALSWDWLWIAIPALSLGFLLVGNSWDFPTYTGLFWLATVVSEMRSGFSRTGLPSVRTAPPPPTDDSVTSPGQGGGVASQCLAGDGCESSDLARPESDVISPPSNGEGQGDGSLGARKVWSLVAPSMKPLAVTSGLSLLMYAPFFLGFASQTRGVGIAADKTPLVSLLIIFGPFLFVLGLFLVWRLWTERAEPSALHRRNLSLGLAFGLSVLAWFVGAFALVLAFLVLAWPEVRRTLGPRGDSAKGEVVAQRFCFLLILLGLLLVLVPEFVFLVDLFGTRMNTVFKFHYQAWLMLGIASSVAFVSLTATARSAALRGVAIIGLVLLAGVGLLYPFTATPSKANGFKAPPTLDGAAFLQTTRADDYAASQWMVRAISGRPVVLEAVGGEYSDYGRVSTFTGLPAVLGWAGHELQWRGRGEEPARRTADVELIYKTADGPGVLDLLKKYGVEYVFVGSLEVERYGPDVLRRFDGLLEPFHRQGQVVIYRVPRTSGQSSGPRS